MALGAVNTTGLPALPTETLHEIVSHFRGIHIPCPSDLNNILTRTYLERSEALLCLAETCRRLRHVFLPLAWKHVEICAHSSITAHTQSNHRRLWPLKLSKQMAMELVWHTEIITLRNPSLAQHVRVVSVALSDWSADKVFPEFFSCLAQLPNLDTLQVPSAPFRYRNARGSTWPITLDPLPGAISGHTFPGVRTLALHPNAFSILECCPNVEHLTLNGYITDLLDLQRNQLSTFAPLLRAFKCRATDAADVKAILDLPRGLHEIPPIHAFNLTPDVLRLLVPMQQLHKIEITATEWQAPEAPAHVVELVRTAKTLLRSPSAQHVAVMLAGGAVRLYPV
ncbi:hypothetical protein C8R43DRAFT_1119763 [Mycena crocata]|nr:hypothetical protein C8R43DRAFT_1119763 [Mycena crocata]